MSRQQFWVNNPKSWKGVFSASNPLPASGCSGIGGDFATDQHTSYVLWGWLGCGGNFVAFLFHIVLKSVCRSYVIQRNMSMKTASYHSFWVGSQLTGAIELTYNYCISSGTNVALPALHEILYAQPFWSDATSETLMKRGARQVSPRILTNCQRHEGPSEYILFVKKSLQMDNKFPWLGYWVFPLLYLHLRKKHFAQMARQRHSVKTPNSLGGAPWCQTLLIDLRPPGKLLHHLTVRIGNRQVICYLAISSLNSPMSDLKKK